MVSFKLLSSTLAAMASLTGLARADDNWGSFTGQVSSVQYIFDKDYSFVSELVIALNQNWTLANLQGRTNGQIANKTIAFNTADSKYYAKIGYTTTANNETSSQICFDPVPITISLNEKVNDSEQGRIVNGFFFIGCIDKSSIINLPSSSPSSTVSSASQSMTMTTSLASTSIITISSISSDASSPSTTGTPTSTSEAASLVIATISSHASVEGGATGSVASTIITISSIHSGSATSSSLPVIATVTAGHNSTGGGIGQTNGAPIKSVASLFTICVVALAMVIIA